MSKGISRRDFLKGALIGGVAAGTGLGHSHVYGQSAQNLRFSTWHPPVSRETKTVWTPMLDKLKEKSKGKIGYTMYAGAALGKAPEHYDIVQKGLSDMGYFTATFTPGRFPLTDVLSLAVWIDGKDLATEIGNAMYARLLNREFKGVKVVELNGCIQSFLWTKKPINKLEEIKGLKIRTPGGHQTNYIKALGGEPVFMPVGDVYMAVETGTVDGIVTCPPMILAFKLHEVAKNCTMGTFGCVSEGVIMNENAWKKTPDDLKPVVDECCHNPFATSGGLTRNVYGQMIKELEGNKVAFRTLNKSDEKYWAERFQEVTRKWVTDLEAKGLPAKQAVIMYNEECEKRNVKLPSFPPEYRKA